MMTLQKALELIQTHIPQARLIGDGKIALARVHTDTRTLQIGDLFVALKGERFDAHDFLPQAQASGAVAALASHGLAQAGLSGIEVPDTLLALGALARAWRAQFELPLIAVTGSNGKTTVTQMIASIFRTHVGGAGDAALATRGNFNNSIGMPLNLLRMSGEHRIAVLEMGMNHPGEIAELAAIGQPTAALVNNAQREHQEFMHTVEAVARENGSVLSFLPKDGVAIFPAGDEYTPLWTELAAGRPCLMFGEAADGAQVFATDVTWQNGAWSFVLHTPQGSAGVQLHIAGRHNVLNALASAACAHAAGVSLLAIAQGLSGFEPVTGRSRALAVQINGQSVTVVDDTYNANPDSVAAAIAVLAELPAPRLLALGDMGEVGDNGPQFHSEAGALAKQAGIKYMYTLGAKSAFAATAFGSGAQHFESMTALQKAACEVLPQVGSVLVKGSRFMKMEQVVQAVQAFADKEQGACKENTPCC
ncbi:UDP-N-acetylmuramoyl-tripeptide--D-alanyl-D-alanine ligase [Comamonas sp. Y33R10-2]|uniref:UDP-N-acetylmuramoyl-tripeptide--D-alanyl-D- alanine ligase n=1 Tax=Comamonas sp. Y33R10-2 TaxID=2853257 RepID=UPI001C5C928C|nr:UDP-N-acetylmuramoyl-tripeptide--D-alanyl-D-alanine ligase [Comamonas sp. Y33R10-2]QXZ09375.1 UDP-N-acetylmuramoyl-tripeptide--D-alanyl-D-alanine ligase [Comamonas sp. Y33R10-2]